MEKHCEDCGMKLTVTFICPNCDEELLIIECQEEGIEFSDEFIERAAAQEVQRTERRMRFALALARRKE